MLGKVAGATEHGVKSMQYDIDSLCPLTLLVGLEFFSDVFVPGKLLMDPSRL